MNNPNINNGQESKGIMNRLSRAVRSRTGKVALGLALASGAALGTAHGVEAAQENHRVEFEATQNQIKPVIEAEMIKIDTATLAEYQAHPKDMAKINAPDGRTVSFTTEHSTVVMGTTEGRPDPNRPIYISYHNNQGTGKGTRGIHVVMTAPEGNTGVNDHSGRDFGGSTEGGWAASIRSQADTTDNTSNKPGPLEAAQDIAETAQEFGPYDPYEY